MSGSNRSLCEIGNFNGFLEKCLGSKVLDYTIKSLTKPGDNYRSVVQLVEVRANDSSYINKNKNINNNKVNDKKRVDSID